MAVALSTDATLVPETIPCPVINTTSIPAKIPAELGTLIAVEDATVVTATSSILLGPKIPSGKALNAKVWPSLLSLDTSQS